MMDIRRIGGAAAGALGITWLVRAVWDIPSAMGASISAIQPHAVGATTYRDRQFHNTEPSSQMAAGSAPSLLVSALTRRNAGRPRGPIPLQTPQQPTAAAALAVTWYGHATTLIEVDGYRILTDPVWSERVSPSALVGPARMHPVPQPLADLPPIDAVIISHDHYDHLDKETVRELRGRARAPGLLSEGLGGPQRAGGGAGGEMGGLFWGGW
ncbi:MBL fold metallo-hydrolase, partial [Nocardia abscessus]|uniref:MBL fold metallo-hydrolase n=1 Tax=Nocardia abscessus TaxID=120957 RepID=UPI003CC7F81F